MRHGVFLHPVPCWLSEAESWEESSCLHTRVKGVQLQGLVLIVPLGVVVPGSRSIEYRWRVWVCVPCPYLCVYMWCKCPCVRPGHRLRLTQDRPPPCHHTLPVENPPGRWYVGGFSPGCSGKHWLTLGRHLARPGPTPTFSFIFLFCFLCPPVLSVSIWLNKKVYNNK